jgi:hypothetical protein
MNFWLFLPSTHFLELFDVCFFLEAGKINGADSGMSTSAKSLPLSIANLAFRPYLQQSLVLRLYTEEGKNGWIDSAVIP